MSCVNCSHDRSAHRLPLDYRSRTMPPICSGYEHRSYRTEIVVALLVIAILAVLKFGIFRS